MIPYGKQSIDQSDIAAVTAILKSDFLTTGPRILEFEKAFAAYVGATYAVAVANGTAALHLSCLAAGLKEGEELITSPLTFAASANCAFYCNAKPVFADINDQGLIDVDAIEKNITKHTRIIIPVHYTGLPCDMEKIHALAKKHNLTVIEDAAHALGAQYKRTRIGDCTYSDMAIFSFHPVKHITTGEGGMITTNSEVLYKKLLLLRTHGITKDPADYRNKDPWYHEMQELGYNYRMTDLQAALGMSQLKKADGFLARRRKIAETYNSSFATIKDISLMKEHPYQKNAYHLYVVRLKDAKARKDAFLHLQKNSIHPQVHYLPVYRHPYYRRQGYKRGLCPKAEAWYARCLSLPMYPSLSDEQQRSVVACLRESIEKAQ